MAKHIGIPPKSPVRRTEMRKLDFGGKDMRSRTKKKPRRTPAPVVEYPAGYFTALIREHNWPPRFEAAPLELRRSETLQAQAQYVARRDAESAAAIGWGSGTIPMARTPAHGRPGWMGGKT